MKRFDAHYKETMTLADGTSVHLRLIGREDKPIMLEAWKRLSPQSRYRRFLSAKTTLSKADLRYLTEVDQTGHFAIGALAWRSDQEIGVGVARFAKLRDRPKAAEPAVLITDDFQGKGLGKILLDRLTKAAWERGIETFVCDVLVTNDVMQSILHHFAPMAAVSYENEVARFEIPLGTIEGLKELPVESTAGPLDKLLHLAAEGVLALRRTLMSLGS